MMDFSKASQVISKVLSANDTGQTGAHQAGMLIPKDPHVLSFFPSLRTDSKNPRVHLRFLDDGGREWFFAFIYYNNGMFGGTRNEYRLTRMTPYIKENGLEPGDEIILSRGLDDLGRITFRRSSELAPARTDVLVIGKDWKVITIKES